MGSLTPTTIVVPLGFGVATRFTGSLINLLGRFSRALPVLTTISVPVIPQAIVLVVLLSVLDL